MAKEISGEWPQNSHKTKYPWDQWLNGNVWELLEGVDFTNDLQRMRVQTYVAAGKRGLKARTSQSGPNKLIIQAYSPEENHQGKDCVARGRCGYSPSRYAKPKTSQGEERHGRSISR